MTKSFWRDVGTYVISVVIVGTLAGLVFWFLCLIGLVRIEGYWRMVREVGRGQLIIAANHPTLIETFLIPVMFWPWALIWPKRFFVWSVPDAKLFGRWASLYQLCHCAPITRENGSNSRSISLIGRILRSSGTVVLHPEEGRTDSPIRGKNIPLKQFGRRLSPKRKLRRITSRVPQLAIGHGARILPLWIEVPFRKIDNGFLRAIWVWISGWHTITFFVGDAYHPDPQADQHQNNKQLGLRLLSA